METKIKNLVKSAVLGVAVLGGAVAMQSFGEKDSATTPIETQQMRYWVNVNGQYEEVASVDPSEKCISNSTEDCALQSTDTEIPSEFQHSEKDDFENLDSHPDSRQGSYDL